MCFDYLYGQKFTEIAYLLKNYPENKLLSILKLLIHSKIQYRVSVFDNTLYCCLFHYVFTFVSSYKCEDIEHFLPYNSQDPSIIISYLPNLLACVIRKYTRSFKILALYNFVCVRC